MKSEKKLNFTIQWDSYIYLVCEAKSICAIETKISIPKTDKIQFLKTEKSLVKNIKKNSIFHLEMILVNKQIASTRSREQVSISYLAVSWKQVQGKRIDFELRF